MLLLPPAGGRLAGRLIEEWFDERHAGRLEIADAWVGSFYGPQRIDSLILRDEEGEEVLRAVLRAPALGEFFDAGDGDGQRVGPLEVRIASLRLAQARDGSTNLTRALAERRLESVERDRFSGGFELVLDVRIERLRFTDAHGHEGALEGIVLRGSLQIDPYETRLVLEGGPDPLSAEPMRALVRLARRNADPSASWKQTFALEDLPSVLAGMLVAAAQPLVGFTGRNLDELAWQRDEGLADLRLRDEGADLTLSGKQEADGVLAGVDASVHLTLPCAGVPGRELLTHLLPLVSAPECPADSPPHDLHLRNCRWPLDGDWSKLAGELDLQPSPARAAPVEALRALLGGEGPRSLALDQRQPVRVRAGVLEYEHFRLPMEAGWLQLDGTLELASGRLDALVTGEVEGQAIDLGRWVGTRERLERPMAEPPESPEAPRAPEAVDGE